MTVATDASTSGRVYQREDDRPESITVRMQAYERSTAPLIDFYRNLGLLLPVVADGSPSEICERKVTLLERRLQKKGEESADQQSISA